MSEYILERNYDTKNGTFSTVKREEIVRCRDCAKAEFPEVHLLNGMKRHILTCVRFPSFQHGTQLCFMVELVNAPGDIVPTVLETWEEVIAYLAKCGEPKAIGSNGFTVRVCYCHGRKVEG